MFSWELVLDRLERADGAAEGVALERIGLGHVERGLRAAQLLEGEEHGGAVEEAAQQRQAVAGRAERLCRRAVEGEARMRAAGVDGRDGFAPHAERVEVEDEQREATLRRPRAARGDDREIGDVAVGHGKLGAAQAAIDDARAQRLGIDRARTLRQRQRADRRARRELRQVALLLRRAAGDEERFAGEIGRGRERHRRERMAELLGEHAEAQMPQPRAAIFLGDRRADPAHPGDLLPQCLVIGAGAIDDAARRAQRVALAQELARLVAQRFEIVGEVEIHGLASVLHALRERAVDDEVGAADEARARARQEHRGVGDLLRRPHSPHRAALTEA